jgi:anti-sigma factor RsiW
VIPDLNCNELVELVTDYLDGVMPSGDRERFEAHLEICNGCTTYLDQIRTTVAITGRLTEESLDPAARDALLAAFRSWHRGRGTGAGA